VRAIDQHRNAGRVAHIDNPLQRQHQRAARGDVVHHNELRPWRQRRCDVGDDHIGVGMWERHVCFHDARTGAFTQVADSVAHRAVAVAEYHDLIVRRETEGTQHRIAAHCRILDKRDILAIGADERA
jgi:hypothetical protein